jgi:succinate dehydrogenase / fumarate reductase, cytochrome b subunit
MANATTSTSRGPLWGLLSSTIGLKVVMAVTGAMWAGFVVQHMLANLQLFLPIPVDGPQAGIHPINRYAATLKDLGALLWVARFVILGAFVAHIVAAIKLTRLNQHARPEPYREKRAIVSTFSSSYMAVTGFAILFFVLYHLAHFTLGLTNPDDFARHLPNGVHDVYSMMILGFRNPIAVAIYCVANVFVALHLHHAATSIFQTLGLRTSRYARAIDMVGPTVAVVVAIGNLAMPIAVLLGLIGGSVA